VVLAVDASRGAVRRGRIFVAPFCGRISRSQKSANADHADARGKGRDSHYWRVEFSWRPNRLNDSVEATLA
jgi:hypothetical protein